MPPQIVCYADVELTKPHTGELGMIDVGSEKEMSIYCRNEGTGELLDVEIAFITQGDGLDAELLNKPPSELAVNAVWEAKLRCQISSDERYGAKKKIELKFLGRYVR